MQTPENSNQFNIADYLMQTNQSRLDRIAYIDGNGSLTYAALFDKVRRLTAVLKNLGVRREERVLLLMNDCTDWPVAFLGAIHAGIVPVAINTLLTPQDYKYIIEDSRCQAAMVSATLLPVLAQAMSEAEHEIKHILVSRPQGELSHGQLSMEQAVAAATPCHRPCSTRADEPAFWLYSSGSTGKPKGTIHSHANPYWTIRYYAQDLLRLTESDRILSAAKLFFAYGLGNALTFPLGVGASVILIEGRPTPDAVFEAMRKHQPTVFCGAPTGYAGMLAAANTPTRDEVQLRMCSSAGEALPRELGERFTAHFGCHIIDGIGSTEMLHIFLSNKPDDIRYGTTGKPVPGYELELRDEQGAIVADGEIGDLYIKGKSAALMYWNNREKTRATFQGEWTKSGDKYSRDADGYYTYAGRSDDMLKVSGQYVSPFEVEATLIEHEAVLEAAVIGVADSQGLVKTRAYVVLKETAPPADDTLKDALKAFVKSRLAPHKYPRSIEFLDELPKTATGKIQRFRLREMNQHEVA
ncbi:benzoate-CoA ligase family protein [Advenella incenata]